MIDNTQLSSSMEMMTDCHMSEKTDQKNTQNSEHCEDCTHCMSSAMHFNLPFTHKINYATVHPLDNGTDFISNILSFDTPPPRV